MLDGKLKSMIYCKFELLGLVTSDEKELKRLGTWEEVASAVEEKGTLEAENLKSISLLQPIALFTVYSVRLYSNEI